MREYIDREKLKKELAPYEENDFSQQIDVILEIVDRQPPANVRPVVRGEWIRKDIVAVCSICGCATNQVPMFANYCSHCGADMRGESK